MLATFTCPEKYVAAKLLSTLDITWGDVAEKTENTNIKKDRNVHVHERTPGNRVPQDMCADRSLPDPYLVPEQGFYVYFQSRTAADLLTEPRLVGGGGGTHGCNNGELSSVFFELSESHLCEIHENPAWRDKTRGFYCK